jgi:hypothetical protein
VIGAGGRGGFLVQREPASGRLVTFDPQSPDGQLLALATTAPHDCEHADCPGRKTKADLELLEQICALLLPHAGETGVSEGAVDVLKRLLHPWEALLNELDALAELLPRAGP